MRDEFRLSPFALPELLTVEVTMPPEISAGDSALACARLVAVPRGTMPTMTVLEADSTVTEHDPESDPMRGEEPRTKNEPPASFGAPVLFRELQLIPLIVRRARTNAEGQTVNYSRIRMQIGIPQGELSPRQVEAGFAQLYQSSALNPPSVTATAPEGYLVIVPDAFYNNVLPLAQWKERKGFWVTVKKKSEVGSTADQIRTYIANAYHTWLVRPEYVLLVGTCDQMPTFTIPGAGVVTDHTYGCIDGNDFFPEVLVGRLPANSGPMLDYLVQKILNYERTPYMGDTLWYRRAMMISTVYQEGGTPTVTALETKRWVRDLMLRRGFAEVDTVFDPPYHGSGVAPVDSSVNKGVCLVNGRGWGNSGGWNYPTYRTADIQGLANGWKLPVVTSLYCGTGAFNANPCFGEAWLQAGSPSQPRGAVAFYGPSWLATSTRWNNCLDYGIYHGILNEGGDALGPAMFRGKLEIFDNFPMPGDSYYLRVYFYTYNLLGDPSMTLWTGAAPRTLSLELPARLWIGANTLTVGTADLLPEALVSIVQGSTVKVTGHTDVGGQASLATPPLTGETLFVTVTKSGYAPAIAYLIPEPSGMYVGHLSHAPDSCSPGATVGLTIVLKNFGTSQTAQGVVARLRSADPLVTIADSVKDYGDIAPGATAQGAPFAFQVSPNCTSGYRLSFGLLVSSGDSNWTSALELPVAGPKFSYRRHDFPGTGYLNPGQSADLVVTILNDGAQGLSNVTGTLVSTSNAVIVEDPDGTFGSLNVGDSASNNSDVFRVSARPDVAVGKQAGFNLVLRGDGGFVQTVHFGIVVGQIGPTAPLGPDAYGYYAYDDVDVSYAEHPTYDWVEIDPNQGGGGTRVNLGNDDVKVVPLPFSFRYYGLDYNRISVCDNGFMACDSTDQHSFYNWRLPSAYGPPNIIAPFWDDFRPDTAEASGVYCHYDAGNHRFVVEWSRVHHVHGFKPPVLAELQTFEAILLDPAFHSTRTGDGVILFQYNTVLNDDSVLNNNHDRASAGIANRTQDIGLQCTFADSLAPAAAPIVDGRAIKFTTNPPDTFAGIEVGGHDLDPKRIRSCPQVELTVEPNPASGWFTIHYVLPSGTGGTIRLIDAGGRVLRTWSVKGTRCGIVSPSGVVPAPGVYFLNLTLQNRESILNIRRKLVVAARGSHPGR
jgi:hypothetical protein